MQENLQQEPYQSSLVPEELPYDFQQHIAAQITPAPPVMTTQKRLGLDLCVAALLAGLSGNLLLCTTPWDAGRSAGTSVALIGRAGKCGQCRGGAEGVSGGGE